MQQGKILVSVCVTTYNVGRFLKQSLDSALAQKRNNFDIEIVVTDNCSTDDTKQILQSYADNYPDIFRIHYNESNLGYVRNYLKCLALCKGNYIAVLDGDDYWTDDEKILKQISFLENNRNCNMSHGNCEIEFSNGERKIFDQRVRPESVYPFSELLLSSRVWNSSVVYRNILKGKFPDWFDELKGNFGVDYLLHILHSADRNIHYINEVVGIYRKHGNNISGQNLSIEFWETAIWTTKKIKKYHVPKKYAPQLSLNISSMEDIICGKLLKQKKYAAAFRYFVSSYATSPFRSWLDYKHSFNHIFRN